MQLSLRNHSNDFLTIDKIRSSAFSTLRIKCHAMKVFFFVREWEIYNSFDCDEIKTTKKIERKLAIHQEIKGGKEIGMETPATL